MVGALRQQVVVADADCRQVQLLRILRGDLVSSESCQLYVISFAFAG